jgi:hypothetical protein
VYYDAGWMGLPSSLGHRNQEPNQLSTVYRTGSPVACTSWGVGAKHRAAADSAAETFAADAMGGAIVSRSPGYAT